MDLEDFISISRYAGMREDLVQAGGGNSSVKIDGKKAAGQRSITPDWRISCVITRKNPFPSAPDLRFLWKTWRQADGLPLKRLCIP